MSSEEKRSLDDIQNDFNNDVGHPPHSVSQMVSFCKQQGHKWKYSQINLWWPTRPDPQSKPKEKPVNEGEYKAKMLEEEEYFVDACYLIKTCKSLKRLCLAMKFLQNNQHLIYNDTEDVLIQYFSRYKHILNDWGHILLDHLNDDEIKNNESFRMIFDEINREIQCDINVCEHYKRNFQSREMETNLQKSELQFYINLMDTIHCHLLHSYDIGLRIKINEASTETKTVENEITEAIAIDNGYNMDAIQLYLNQRFNLSQIIDRKNKFRSDIYKIGCNEELKDASEEPQDDRSPDINSEYMDDSGIYKQFYFGDLHRFYYWKYYQNNDEPDTQHNIGYNYGDWYIEPHFDNFKNEILNHLSIRDYQYSLQKAQKFIHTEHIKAIKWTETECNKYYGFYKTALNDYNPECLKEPTLTEEHLLSIILFTDYYDLSQKLKQSFITTSSSGSEMIILVQCDDELKQKNSYFAHWSRLLRECVEVFGNDTQTSNTLCFYHEMDSLPFVDQFSIKLNALTSTTSNLTVSVLYNNTDSGIIVDLKQNESSLQFFHCSFLSNYSYENEKLLFCGSSMKISNIRVFDKEIQLWQEYGNYMKSISMYEQIMEGNQPLLNENAKKNIVNQQDFKTISDLASYQLGNECQQKYPDYIHKLFSMYCKRKRTLTIDLSQTNHLYNFLQHLNGSKYIDLLLPIDEIGNLYKNCQEIMIKQSKVILVYDNFFYHMMEILDNMNQTNLKMITILSVYVKCENEDFRRFQNEIQEKNWNLLMKLHETTFNDLLISRKE